MGVSLSFVVVVDLLGVTCFCQVSIGGSLKLVIICHIYDCNCMYVYIHIHVQSHSHGHTGIHIYLYMCMVRVPISVCTHIKAHTGTHTCLILNCHSVNKCLADFRKNGLVPSLVDGSDNAHCGKIRRSRKW